MVIINHSDTMHAPKLKTKRSHGLLTPQQKFAKNAGEAWRSMSGAQKDALDRNFMSFMKILRACTGHLNMSPAELKACAN